MSKFKKLWLGVDYSLGVAAVSYGVYAAQPLAIGAGVLGLTLTHFKAADRVKAAILSMVSAKQSSTDHSVEIAQEQAAMHADATSEVLDQRQQMLATPGIQKYCLPAIPVMNRFEHPYTHNQLRGACANLYQPKPKLFS